MAFLALYYNREEKSLRHLPMVPICLDDNKPIKSLKSPFAPVSYTHLTLPTKRIV